MMVYLSIVVILCFPPRNEAFDETVKETAIV